MFTSPTLEYIKETGYEGVIIKFRMKKGTIDELKAIGTVKEKDMNSKYMKDFGKMPINQKGWMENNTLFKIEKEQVNIGLGRNGKGMKIFNDNIVEFEIAK